MKHWLIILLLHNCTCALAQLYIAPGDSVSVLPGTQLYLQEDLQNNGKIYNNGTIVFNGTALQQISGTGNIDNVTADNNTVMTSNCIINNQLSISSGKIFDLSNYQLINNGSISGAGMLRGSVNAGLVLTGSSAVLQFDNAVDGTSNALKKCSISNAAVVLQNKLYLYDVLQPSSGTLTLNDELVLRSSASATARVDVVGAGITYGVAGKFVIERYIPGRRAWRLLTAPVSPGSTVKISEAWQDGAPRVTNVNNINSTNNPRPGYGTHITFGLPATNGYDQGVNGNTSIRYLNASGWNGVPSATNDGSTLNSGIITDQPGYMLFVRGDRSTLLWQATGAFTTPAVLRPKGAINTGTLNVPLGTAFNSGGSVFRVIGNPYPSAINFHAIATDPVNAANGFADAFYVWDPSLTGNNGVGGFVGLTYNAAASIAAGKPVYDRSVSSSIANTGDIPSGSAIVIDYAGAASTMRVLETYKSVETTVSFARPANQLSLSLLALNSDSTVSLNDGLQVAFDDAQANAVDQHDLKKLLNFAENIAVWKDSMQLCVEKRSTIQSSDSICLYISKMKLKQYRLQLSFAENTLPVSVAPFLRDDFLSRQTPLMLADTNTVDFNITQDAASYQPRRFTIFFKKINPFAFCKAVLNGDEALINWQLADTFQVNGYMLQRSTDGIHFTDLLQTGQLYASDNTIAGGVYYYRVQCINGQGVITYSPVAQLKVPARDYNIYVYPNPVKTNRFTVFIRKPFNGEANYRLTDNSGAVVQAGMIQIAEASNIYSIVLRQKFPSGVYRLHLLQAGHMEAVIPVNIQLP